MWKLDQLICLKKHGWKESPLDTQMDTYVQATFFRQHSLDVFLEKYTGFQKDKCFSKFHLWK